MELDDINGFEGTTSNSENATINLRFTKSRKRYANNNSLQKTAVCKSLFML